MKLHSLKIQNFRAIENSQFDFTDHFSKPKPVNLIIGPNGSGKTSILDAILIVVRTLENPQRPHLRDALEFSVPQLVHGEGKQAKIEFEYVIQEDEAFAINEVFRAFNQEPPFKFKGDEPPLNSPACVSWTLPTWQLDDKNDFSVISNGSTNTLGARGQIAQAVSKNRLRASLFERVDGVCYLEQRCSLQLVKNYSLQPQIDNLSQDEVLSRLNVYYWKHLTWNEDKYGESYWHKIQRLFNQICSPAQLVRLESGPDSDTLIIEKDDILSALESHLYGNLYSCIISHISGFNNFSNLLITKDKNIKFSSKSIS